MATEKQTIEYQKEHKLPSLPGNERFHADPYETVIEGTIQAQINHFFDPRLDFIDRTTAVQNLIIDYVVLSLVQAGLSLEDAENYPDLGMRVFTAMVRKGFVFSGNGRLAV